MTVKSLLTSVSTVATGYWFAQIGSSSEGANSVVCDASNNVYIAGSTGSTSAILIKQNSSGVIQWQRKLGSNGETANDVDIDSSSNLYYSGITSDTGTGSAAILLAKYDSSGAIQFQRKLGTYSIAYGVKVDSTGYVYVSGFTSNSAGTSDYFYIAKYNTTGTLQWQRQIGTSGIYTDGYKVELDSSGNVYVCGYTLVSGAQYAVIVKYNSSGTLQWQRRIGSSSTNTQGVDLTVDSSGNVYVVGVNTATYTNMFLAKYDTSGTLQWQRLFGSTSSENYLYANGIMLNTSGDPYIVGYSAAGNGAYIVKYNSSGTLQWQRQLSSSTYSALSAVSIFIDTSSAMNIVGGIDSYPNTKILTMRLPSDGSLTGTYSHYTYSVSSLSSYTGSLTSSTPTLTSSTPTLTSSTPTLTSATSTLASTLTLI